MQATLMRDIASGEDIISSDLANNFLWGSILKDSKVGEEITLQGNPTKSPLKLQDINVLLNKPKEKKENEVSQKSKTDFSIDAAEKDKLALTSYFAKRSALGASLTLKDVPLELLQAGDHLVRAHTNGRSFKFHPQIFEALKQTSIDVKASDSNIGAQIAAYAGYLGTIGVGPEDLTGIARVTIGVGWSANVNEIFWKVGSTVKSINPKKLIPKEELSGVRVGFSRNSLHIMCARMWLQGGHLIMEKGFLSNSKLTEEEFKVELNRDLTPAEFEPDGTTIKKAAIKLSTVLPAWDLYNKLSFFPGFESVVRSEVEFIDFPDYYVRDHDSAGFGEVVAAMKSSSTAAIIRLPKLSGCIALYMHAVVIQAGNRAARAQLVGEKALSNEMENIRGSTARLTKTLNGIGVNQGLVSNAIAIFEKMSSPENFSKSGTAFGVDIMTRMMSRMKEPEIEETDEQMAKRIRKEAREEKMKGKASTVKAKTSKS